MESNNNSWREPTLLKKIVNIVLVVNITMLTIYFAFAIMGFAIKATTAPFIAVSKAQESAGNRACEHFFSGSKASGVFGTQTCWIQSDVGAKKVGEVEAIVNKDDLAKGKAASDAIWKNAFWPFDLPFTKSK